MSTEKGKFFEVWHLSTKECGREREALVRKKRDGPDGEGLMGGLRRLLARIARHWDDGRPLLLLVGQKAAGPRRNGVAALWRMILLL